MNIIGMILFQSCCLKQDETTFVISGWWAIALNRSELFLRHALEIALNRSELFRTIHKLSSFRNRSEPLWTALNYMHSLKVFFLEMVLNRSEPLRAIPKIMLRNRSEPLRAIP